MAEHNQDKTVSQKTAEVIKKIDWDNQRSEPIKQVVSKDELAKDINTAKVVKTSFSLTLTDRDNLEDVYHYLKKSRRKYTKSDIISEALNDMRQKYLRES